MYSAIAFVAMVACVAARPGYYLHGVHDVHTAPVLDSAKSTLTQSSHAIDHGSTYHLHTPTVHVVQAVHPVHVVHAVHAVPVVGTRKSTVTNSSHAINHGATFIAHVPVAPTPTALAVSLVSSEVHHAVPVAAYHH